MHINLPGISGISGIEALKALAADARTAHIPVIAVSANAMPRDIETGLAAGFFRDLTKPIKVPEFMQTLDLALRASKAVYTQVASTTASREVCAMHRAQPFDLILRDLRRPGMDSFEVMAGLKAADVDASVPVIVLTAQPAHKLRALASDWYWEQNETGDFTQVSGPVPEMLGLRMASFLGQPSDGAQGGHNGARPSAQHGGWIESERAAFQAHIAARQPFSNFGFSRLNADATRQHYRVSGEPIFNQAKGYTGYRGIGAKITLTGPPEPPAAHTAQ